MEQYEYLDCLIDFAAAIQTYGPDAVAADFRKNYPEKNAAFVKAALQVNRQQQVAALFKPVIPKEL